MFRWLKNLLTPREEIIPVEEDLDDDEIYKPKDRLIFKYFDGEKIVSADPMVVYRRMIDVSIDLNADITIATSPSKAAPEAYQKMVEKLRKIFQVKPLELGGLTENETFLVYINFSNFCDFVKKNSKNVQILQEVISENTQKAEEKSLVMKPILDSTLIEKDNKIEK